MKGKNDTQKIDGLLVQQFFTKIRALLRKDRKIQQF